MNRRKVEEEFKISPYNPKKLSPSTGLPFLGASSYQNSFTELPKEGPTKSFKKIASLHPLPFTGRSSYKNSYQQGTAVSKAVPIKPK